MVDLAKLGAGDKELWWLQATTKTNCNDYDEPIYDDGMGRDTLRRWQHDAGGRGATMHNDDS